MLQSVIVSRVFTIYQLAHLIIYELPKIIKQFSSTSIITTIVIYGLLHLFVSDPHTDKEDAKKLTKEIASSLRKISKDRFIIVSLCDVAVFLCTNNGEAKQIQVEMKIQQARMKATQTKNNKNNYKF